MMLGYAPGTHCGHYKDMNFTPINELLDSLLFPAAFHFHFYNLPRTLPKFQKKLAFLPETLLELLTDHPKHTHQKAPISIPR